MLFFPFEPLSFPPSYSPLYMKRIASRSISQISELKLPRRHLQRNEVRQKTQRATSSSMGYQAASWGRRTPAWLGPLLGAEFFKPCADHPYLVKNECNHYCLDCAGEDDAVCCTLCVSAHRNHHVVQIRKSSYREVIRVAELKAVADVSLVQTYVINYDRVVFLNRRPQAPQHGVKCVGPAGACRECGRGLVDASFRFCSLGCKLDGMVSDPNLTFMVHPRRNQENSCSNREDEVRDDDDLSGASDPPPGWISYRGRPRKGVPERPPFY